MLFALHLSLNNFIFQDYMRKFLIFVAVKQLLMNADQFSPLSGELKKKYFHR